MKVCTQCKEEKTLTSFDKDRRQRCGRRPECKVCNKQRPAYLLKSARQRVNKTKWYKGVELNITVDDIAELNKACYLCGRQVIDNGCLHRIDSKGHYEKGNIVKMHNSCHAKLHWINRFKDNEIEG